MRHSKLAGMVLIACAVLGFSATRDASADPFSLHPSACVLARNTTPFAAISGATYAGALFTNSSGATANAYCPMPFQSGFESFQITTTSSATSCTLQQMATGGGTTVFFGTHTGNAWDFTTTLNPGTYVLQAVCVLANGAGIRHMMNF
jgi:hypothetical protein